MGKFNVAPNSVAIMIAAFNDAADQIETAGTWCTAGQEEAMARAIIEAWAEGRCQRDRLTAAAIDAALTPPPAPRPS